MAGGTAGTAVAGADTCPPVKGTPPAEASAFPSPAAVSAGACCTGSRAIGHRGPSTAPPNRHRRSSAGDCR
eukprot:15472206-Alexandrium_andersonii.AAC.1